MWGVNAALVLQIEAGLGGDSSKLFVETVINVPIPAKPVPSLIVNTSLVLPNYPGLYEADGDGPAIPVGTKHLQDGVTYIKVGPVGYEFASPYPDNGVYLWAVSA